MRLDIHEASRHFRNFDNGPKIFFDLIEDDIAKSAAVPGQLAFRLDVWDTCFRLLSAVQYTRCVWKGDVTSKKKHSCLENS